MLNLRSLRLLAPVLLVVVLALASLPVQTISAQPPTPTPTPATGPRERISLQDLRLGDQTVRGLQTSAEFFFPGAGDTPLLDGNFLELDFGHSDLIIPPSSMTIVMNDLPLRGVRLDDSNIRRTRIRIEIPREALRRDFNRLTLLFRLLINNDECVSQEDPAAFAVVYNTTAINYRFNIGGQVAQRFEPNLADWPQPYVIPNFPVASDPRLVVPDNATPAELSSAASILAHFARARGGTELKAEIVFAGQLTPAVLADHHAVLIGTPERNRWVAEALAVSQIRRNPDGQFVTPTGVAVAPTSGIITEVASPWRPARAALIVSSQTDEGMQKATIALANRLSRSILSGTFTVVDSFSPDLLRPSSNAAIETVLFESESVIRGVGSGFQSTSFFSPALRNDGIAVLNLNVKYSQGLDRSRSNLVIELNQIPVATQNLNDESGTAQPRIVLPRTAFNPGRNTLTFRFNLYVPITNRDCGSIAPERAWAIIQPDTVLAFSGGAEVPSLDLRPEVKFWPFPFVAVGSSERSIVVISDDDDAGQLLNISRQLGSVTTTDAIWLQVRRQSQLTEEDRALNNLVVAVPPSSSLVQDELAPYLPLQLRPDGTIRLLEGAGRAVFDVNRGGSFGILEVLVSPWNPQRWVLLVTGSDTPGAIRAQEALDTALPPGNVVTVDNQGRVASVTTTPFIRGVDEARAAANLVLYTTIGIVVGILALFGLLLVRWSRGEFSTDRS